MHDFVAFTVELPLLTGVTQLSKSADLGKKIKPNYELLNNAIKQTEGKDFGLDERNIKDFLLGRLPKIDFKLVKKDVEKFLEDKNELQLLKSAVIAKSITDLFTTFKEG